MADFKDDLDILNYVLTLELLEAEMYKQIVASGKLAGDEQRFAVDFGAQEAAHVTILRQAIVQMRGIPVAAPARYNFPSFDTRDRIVAFIVTLEELGARAYLGAVPEIRSPDLLTVVARIHNVEGAQASIWQYQAKGTPIAGAFAVPAKRAEVLAVVAPLLGNMANAPTIAMATGATPGTSPSGSSDVVSPVMLPRTGLPDHRSPTWTATVIGAIAAIGVGASLRSRSHKTRRHIIPPGAGGAAR